MNTLRNSARRVGAVLAAALLCVTACPAFAATTTARFSNDYTSDAIYLWSADPATLLDSVSFGGAASAWTASTLTPTHLAMTGPLLAPAAGRFDVTFSYTPPASSGAASVSFEWAEVLWAGGVPTIQGAGTLALYGRSTWRASGSFSHTADIAALATPLPPSVVLFAGAIAGMIVVRRRPAKAY
ncbi:MAG: hypothetical protein IT495_00300 [Gammaproteobacteria bacterium]|nr:hypothetical protein [Gammaproteobacteria bacterium]